MKWMIASDLHGSAYYCTKMLEALEREQAERLLLLGDLLYHGPRNDLPRDYAPKQVIPLLNGIRTKLVCVRGNCDAEVDQMVLGFPIMADYGVIELGGRFVYLTHGHVYGEDNPPKLRKGDILIQGHTHIQRCVEKDGIMFLNPGSVSIPKGDGYNGCIVFDDEAVAEAFTTTATLKTSPTPKAGELRDIGLEKGAFRFVGLDGVL